MEKSNRNKTIDLSQAQVQKYLQLCSQNGEYKNQILHGDFFKVVEKLPHSFVDLLIADPPYNLTKNFNSSTFRQRSLKDYEIYTQSWIEKCIPLLSPNASIYVCCDWRSSIVIGNVLSRYFTIQNRITWQRDKGRGAKSNWKNSMEDIWFCTLSNNYTFNLDKVKQRRKVLAPYTQNGQPKDWCENNGTKYRDTAPSNFWDDITIPYWSMKENTSHPTQKPEKLIAKLILASSNEGDFVFDPFIGSGTTPVTAKKLNRNFSGIELDDYYCAIAQYRLTLADNDKSIQGYNGIFYDRNMKID